MSTFEEELEEEIRRGRADCAAVRDKERRFEEDWKIFCRGVALDVLTRAALVIGPSARVNYAGNGVLALDVAHWDPVNHVPPACRMTLTPMPRSGRVDVALSPRADEAPGVTEMGSFCVSREVRGPAEDFLRKCVKQFVYAAMFGGWGDQGQAEAPGRSGAVPGKGPAGDLWAKIRIADLEEAVAVDAQRWEDLAEVLDRGDTYSSAGFHRASAARLRRVLAGGKYHGDWVEQG